MNTQFRTVCIAVLATVLSFTLTAQNTQETLRRADTQFDLYAYNTALASYNEVLNAEPNNAYALGRKADCYFQLNRPTEALPFYDRAMTLGRVDPEISFRYAQALMQTGDYVGAKRWFNFYADANPSTGQHYAAMCDYAQTAAQRAGTFSAKNELINTPFADYSPAFYGEYVVYSSARRDLMRKNPRGEAGAGTNELLITRKSKMDGMLEQPNFYLPDLQKSTFFNEGPLAFSASGNKVAFCHNKFIDGTRQIASKGMEMSLYLADLNTEGKWNSPKPFPYNSSDYAVGFPWLSEDGNTVYFASNMPGGLGGWDLYSSSYNATTGMWSTPRNLGPSINTSGNEITPFIDGNDIYFSSDWHNGLGGLDVFRADFVNGYASNLVNLGPGVNSPRDDYGFIYDSKSNTGYFTSNRSDSKGNEDVYQIGRAREEFSITVRDQYQQLIPDAEIDFSACGAGVMRTDQNGRYEFATAKGQANCTVTVRKAGYPSSMVQISSVGEHDIAVVLGTNSGGISPQAASANALCEAMGIVVEHETRDPIYGAKVAALPWPSGPAIEAFSNYNGQYTLNLEAEKAYTLNITRDGYKPLSTNVFSGKGGTQTTINQVSLAKEGKNSTEMVNLENVKTRPGSAQTTDYYKPQESSNNQNAAYTPPIFTPGDLVQPQPSNERTSTIQTTKTVYTPTPAPQPTFPVANPTLSGYAVQLGATPMDAKQPDMNRFEPLSEYGKIYTVQEGKFSKLRLGVFTDRKDAEAALKKAKTIKKDAFIVDERDIDSNMAVELEQDATGAITMVTDKKSGYLQTPNIAPLPVTQFAVQIKTVDANAPIIINDYADLAQYGNLYTRPDNGVTRIRVGVWSVQADAEMAQSLIMAQGHKEAVVIVEKAGSELPAAAKPQVPVTPPIIESEQPGSMQTPKSPAANTGGGAVPAFTPVADQGIVPDLMSPVSHSTQQGNTGKMLAIDDPSTKYLVRICSLSGDIAKFDTKKAEKAGGKVDARQSETGAIIMLLSNFPDQQAATIAKEKLIASGFKDAFVVKEVNNDGILRRIAE